eukprot:TRINITY_DN5155_c0_g1_i1.p4 TRINITY_DN5155_c0_g1~~TRINITY_DN5155_c0_g1_i1.p4  ORF type:complete len:140 (-),score=19.99 TRINITY_DN5155_c0_g1_i1:334-753(-)
MQRVIAQLILAGGAVFIRAAVQAYQQALKNSQTTGVARETLQNVVKGKQMTLEEAFKILGLTSEATIQEIEKKYKHLFDVNQRSGSFYLQSKVFRAWERLDQEFGISKQTDNQQQQQQDDMQKQLGQTQNPKDGDQNRQ